VIETKRNIQAQVVLVCHPEQLIGQMMALQLHPMITTIRSQCGRCALQKTSVRDSAVCPHLHYDRRTSAPPSAKGAIE
jgi:hypothetical protein